MAKLIKNIRRKYAIYIWIPS